MASAIKPLVMAWQYFPVSLPSCSVKSSALKEPPVKRGSYFALPSACYGSTHSPVHENLLLLPSLVIGPPGIHSPLPVTPAYLPVPPCMAQVQSLKSGFVAPFVATKISPSMSVTVQTPL
jgi:hypothetical protein